jgi:ribosomal protein L7/L12
MTTLPLQTQAKVKELLQSGQKITAIQFLCAEHKLSLTDAKDWILYLAGEISSAPGTPTSANSPALMRARAEYLLQSNNKIQAVKLLMDEYQISLKQAKELVDAAAGRSNFSLLKNPIGIVLFVFAGLGSLFLALSLYWLWQDYSFTQKAVTVLGIVVDLNYDSDDRESGAAPVVEFSWHGQKQIFYGSTYSNPPAVEIGEEIEVFVDPDNPKQAVLNMISERYILIFVFGFLGFVFCMIGFIGIWMSGK